MGKDRLGFKLGFNGRSPTRPRRGHIESRRDISSAARHISSPEGTYRLRVFVDIHPSGVRYASGIGLRLDIPLSRLDMRLWRKNSPTNPNLQARLNPIKKRPVGREGALPKKPFGYVPWQKRNDPCPRFSSADKGHFWSLLVSNIICLPPFLFLPFASYPEIFEILLFLLFSLTRIPLVSCCFAWVFAKGEWFSDFDASDNTLAFIAWI